MKPEKPLPVLNSLHRIVVSLPCAGGTDSAVACKKGGVFLYWMDTGELEDEATFFEYYKAMSRERQRKLDSFLLRKDQRLSLGAGILMDQGLSAWGLRERETKVSYREKGKPYLPNYPQIHFNLSHSGSRALAVFAGVENGCDIEQVQKADLDLAEHFFTPGEYEFIAGQQGSTRRDEAFTRLWTLKESFLKAVGAGLALSLDAFEITISSEGKIVLCKRSKEAQVLAPGEFVFREYQLEGYCAAVCFWKEMGRTENRGCPDVSGNKRKVEGMAENEGIDHRRNS